MLAKPLRTIPVRTLTSRVLVALRQLDGDAARRTQDMSYPFRSNSALGFRFVVASVLDPSLMPPDQRLLAPWNQTPEGKILLRKRILFDIQTSERTEQNVDLGLVLQLHADTLDLDVFHQGTGVLHIENFGSLSKTAMGKALKPVLMPLAERLVAEERERLERPVPAEFSLAVDKAALYALATLYTTHPPLVALRKQAKETLEQENIRPRLDTPLDELGLPKRAVTVFAQDHLHTLEHLLMQASSGYYLSCTPGLGPVTLIEVMRVLKDHGIHIAQG